MSAQTSVPYFVAAREAAVESGPDSQQARSNLSQAIEELKTDANRNDPPIADWIVTGLWFLEQALIVLEDLLTFIDGVLAAIEEPPE